MLLDRIHRIGFQIEINFENLILGLKTSSNRMQ